VLVAGIAILTVVVFTIAMIRDDSASQLAAVVSPDGQKIAYFSEEDGVSTLYVTDRQKLRPTPIADIELPDGYALSWSTDGSFLVYNATERVRPYYAINVVRPNGDSAIFIKFAKDQARHATDSVPMELNCEIATVNHDEWIGDGYRIHRVDVLGETLSVMFAGHQITGFAWSNVPFEQCAQR